MKMICGDPRFDQRSSAFRSAVIRVSISGHLRQGQVTIEYFILFVIVAMLTLIGFTSLNGDIRTSLKGFVNAAAAKIAN